MKAEPARRAGFTLIELLIVVAIGGIFAGTQFALMSEGVRRHDRVTRQAAVQGEARNILEAFAEDARAAVELPDSVEGVTAGPEDFVLVRRGRDGGRTVVVYSLSPGERIRAGKDGPEDFLEQKILTRTEWRPEKRPEETGRRVVSRVVELFECEVRRGGARPLIVCSVWAADVSDGKRIITRLASAFAPRVEGQAGGEEAGKE
jgi:prepilin-type N-terminal cleavage/methylation domain-containing protein